jgi:hypothetical protein
MQKSGKAVVPRAKGGGTVVPASKWRSAGDAIVAAQRLRKEETAVYRPEERRVTLAPDKALAASRQQSATEQRQLAKAGQASHQAAKVGDANGLARLVQAEPAAANWEDENGVTPLLYASAYGRLPCAEVLCGAGARSMAEPLSLSPSASLSVSPSASLSVSPGASAMVRAGVTGALPPCCARGAQAPTSTRRTCGARRR